MMLKGSNYNRRMSLKQLRERAGISQAVVMRRLDVSQRTLTNWENGQTYPRLSLDQWFLLAEMYDVTLHELAASIRENLVQPVVASSN